MYNYHLEKPTGIRIAGSAMLCSHNEVLQTEIQDIVGFFLISKVSERKHPLNLKTLSRFGQQVFVKGRYTGIVMAAYPKLNIVSVEDVEDAVLAGEKGCVGLEIVQSGSTVKRKGLFLHGGPLFLSESLYVVDYDRYVSSEALRKVIELLNPVGYFEESRLKQFAKWYRALEINLGNAWTDKPPITELFCESSDSEHGLRPYRLKTRHWKPSDTYQRDQAQQGIDRAHKQLLGYYQKICQSTPLSVFSRNTSLWLCLPIILLMFAFPNTIFAQQTRVDTEALADRIANSVNELVGNYRTIAISRIKQRSRKRAIDLEQLIDYTNVKIVRGERFQVTDRSKLQLILKEQKIQLSEFVSPNDYRELGKLLGVELFVYGTVYDEALILKAIDVQNSSIAWAGCIRSTR